MSSARLTAFPSLNALLAFHMAAAHGSFSAAARALHVTQGAISHRIRGLEEELGTPLFARVGRRVRLTEAGEVLAESTRDAFASIGQGLERIQAMRGGAKLTMSCSPSFALRWLVPHLVEVQQELGEVEIGVVSDDRVVPPGANGIDLCIRYGPGGYTGVDAVELGSVGVTPVAAPSVAARLQRPSDLLGERLLSDEMLADHPGHVGWEQWLEAAGVRVTPAQVQHFSHAHMALDAAAAGQGVALARTPLVLRELRDGRLVRPFALALPSGLSYWALLPSRGATPTALHLRDWLVEALKRELERVDG